MIPNKISIGGIVYDVKFEDKLFCDTTKINGHIKYSTTEILVENNLSEQIKRVTVWHEIIHGILTQAAIEHEEKLVEVLAYGLTGVIQDNPELLQ